MVKNKTHNKEDEAESLTNNMAVNPEKNAAQPSLEILIGSEPFVGNPCFKAENEFRNLKQNLDTLSETLKSNGANLERITTRIQTLELLFAKPSTRKEIPQDFRGQSLKR